MRATLNWVQIACKLNTIRFTRDTSIGSRTYAIKAESPLDKTLKECIYSIENKFILPHLHRYG